MNTDVLIIGAGVLGLSSAYHVKRLNPSKRVTVIERFSSPGQENTAKSMGAFRNIFTSETNFLLTDSTIDWLIHLQSDLGHDIDLHKIGYLWLFSERQFSKLDGALARIKGRGAETTLFEKEDLNRLLPDLVTEQRGDEDAEFMGLEDVDHGLLGYKCGSLNADALARSYERLFLEEGGKIKYNVNAKTLLVKSKKELGISGEPFVWQDKEIKGVETSVGNISAETTIVACGTWAGGLLEPTGFDTFMHPKKRQLFAFKDQKLQRLISVKGLNADGVLPLTILPKAGIHLRTEISEGSIWMGCADNIPRRFGLEDDPQPEADYYSNNIYHALIKYLPCFKNVRPTNSWAGQYDVNSLDETPVIYQSEGLIYVGASSGSGIMKSDALGRIAAASYMEKTEAELYGERRFKISDLGVKYRRVEHEEFVL